MGTPLVSLPLITPGLYGLNTAYAASTNLGPEWATVFQNTYFDINGRVAARQGWSNQTTTPPAGTPNVSVLFEYIQQGGTTQVIWGGSDNKLYLGFVTPTPITGSLTPTGALWQFLNFNNKCIGIQAGNTATVYTGTGNFANIVASSGTVPQATCGVAAFGRLWLCGPDNNTISYCGLLDETNWGNAGSGTINMASIWTHGTDQVVGIAAVGANLVVFGKRHIIMFADGSGSLLGLDPTQMYVVDTVEGTGLLSRDTVQLLGTGDLLYLSPTGVQALSRVVQNKNNPLESLDRHCWDYIKAFYATETDGVYSLYSPNDYLYLLILPLSGRTFAYDTRRPIVGSPLIPDGSLRISEWLFAAQCGVTRANLNVLFGFAGGLTGLYNGYQDNGTSYQYTYLTPYIADIPSEDQGQFENRRKIPKRLSTILFSTATNTVTYSWSFDFGASSTSAQLPISGSEIPEWGTFEYGANGVYNVNVGGLTPGVDVSQWGGSLTIFALQTPMSGTGRWLQLGVSATINGSNLAIQQLDVYLKPGNMV